MNKVLFSARVTEEVPPRITLASHDVPLQKDGAICTHLTVKAGRQITVHIGNKTLINEAAEDLASAHDCGKRMALHQVGQNTYAYTDDFEDARVGNLSQVTLQARGSSLVARFTQVLAGPVVPVMPGALPAVQAPVAVAPVVAAAPQPPVTPLRGDLPQEAWSNNTRLLGIPYKDYQWYVKNPNRPSGGKDQADYDLLYPIFVKEERLYATLQEKLRAAAAHERLTGCLSEHALISISDTVLPAREKVSYSDYKRYVNAPQRSSSRQLPDYNFLCPIFLQEEKDYLAQQARNEYNAAS